MKKAFYALAATVLIGLNNTTNAIDFGQNKVDQNLSGGQGTVDTALQVLVGNVMTFLGILAVLIMLWGGFNILTAAGDEEKVKKGKTILIQAGLGLVVIFLANSIIQWILGVLFV